MKGQPDSWKRKVHPLFLESASAYRRAVMAWLALGPQPPAEKVASIDARLRQEIEAVRTRYAQMQYTPTADDPLDIILGDAGPSSRLPSQSETDQWLAELLYWKRFQEPLWIAIQKAEAGDLDAFRRVYRVGEDYERLRFGKGPIKATKGDPDHAALFEFGLDMGLSILTSEELADCFDEVCPCGKSHDADALKKQRSRKQKAVQKAIEWFVAERAKMSTREWMFVYGKDGLCAKGVPSMRGHPQRRVYVGQIGKQAEAYVNEKGELMVRKGSRFARRSALRTLPTAFEVNSIKELFTMFFPNHEGVPLKSTEP